MFKYKIWRGWLRNLLSSVAPDKTLKLYDGCFHDPLNHVGKETVMADITSWIEARLRRSAKSSADD